MSSGSNLFGDSLSFTRWPFGSGQSDCMGALVIARDFPRSEHVATRVLLENNTGIENESRSLNADTREPCDWPILSSVIYGEGRTRVLGFECRDFPRYVCFSISSVCWLFLFSFLCISLFKIIWGESCASSTALKDLLKLQLYVYIGIVYSLKIVLYL